MILPYRARQTYGGNWSVEQTISCINGLSAWFTVCTVHEASEAETGYSDGAFGSAQDRAEAIAKALNHPYLRDQRVIGFVLKLSMLDAAIEAMSDPGALVMDGFSRNWLIQRTTGPGRQRLLTWADIDGSRVALYRGLPLRPICGTKFSSSSPRTGRIHVIPKSMGRVHNDQGYVREDYRRVIDHSETMTLSAFTAIENDHPERTRSDAHA